jgi:anti-sigma factor RsiW
MGVCIKYQEQISAKIDQELDGKDLQTLNDHLTSCSECKKLETDLLEIQNGIFTQPNFNLSSDFNSKLMDKIKVEKRGRKKTKTVSLRSIVTYAAGVAAVLFSFVIINNNEISETTNQGQFLTDQGSEIQLNVNDSTLLDSLKSPDQIKSHELKTYQVSDEK